MASAISSKGSHGCVIGSKITRIEMLQIQELIEAGVYLNASDFVQDAIRDKLAAIKVVNAPRPKGRGFYRFCEEIAFPISEC